MTKNKPEKNIFGDEDPRVGKAFVILRDLLHSWKLPATDGSPSDPKPKRKK